MMSAANKAVKYSEPLHILRQIVWIVWLSVVVYTAISSGGYRSVEPFNHSYMGLSLHTEGGMAYPIYFIVLAIIVVLTIVFGRRSACHSFCHMANFMLLGKKLGKLLHLPRVYLKMDSAECIGCKKCTTVCPMSLDVEDMVKHHITDNPYCILCGDCTQACSKGIIRLAFGKPNRADKANLS